MYYDRFCCRFLESVHKQGTTEEKHWRPFLSGWKIIGQERPRVPYITYQADQIAFHTLDSAGTWTDGPGREVSAGERLETTAELREKEGERENSEKDVRSSQVGAAKTS